MKLRKKRPPTRDRVSESDRYDQDNADRVPAPDPNDAAAQVPKPFYALVSFIAIVSAGLWAYWSTLSELVASWSREPDYSHGFLVAPLAAYFLWVRRQSIPGMFAGNLWAGMSLLAISLAMRYTGAIFFLEFLDGWSILFWLAGVVAALGGLPLLRWSWPAIAFLWFMVPLPFSAEGLLSHPLQRVATKFSCFALQVIGQPAIAEGNVIHLDGTSLEVAQACSGLRLFVSIFALAFACVVIVRKSWVETVLLLISAVPIAVLANSARIVATGVLLPRFTSESARQFVHDAAGWGTIPLAALMFGMLVWYLGKLLIEEDELDMATLVRQTEIPGRRRAATSAL